MFSMTQEANAKQTKLEKTQELLERSIGCCDRIKTAHQEYTEHSQTILKAVEDEKKIVSESLDATMLVVDKKDEEINRLKDIIHELEYECECECEGVWNNTWRSVNKQ